MLTQPWEMEQQHAFDHPFLTPGAAARLCPQLKHLIKYDVAMCCRVPGRSKRGLPLGAGTSPKGRKLATDIHRWGGQTRAGRTLVARSINILAGPAGLTAAAVSP